MVALLDDLAARALSRCQVKNVARTAMALAMTAGRELEPQDIRTSLKSMEDFERGFVEAMEECRTQDDGRHTHGYGGPAAPGNGQKRRRLA
jgi:hypothetical protein